MQQKEELDMQSEAFIKEEFNESCNFDVDDAVTKLEKLGLVSRDSEDKYRCVSMKEANNIMGTTTEEMVLKARRDSEYEDEETTETEPQMNPQDELTAKEERFQSTYNEFETLWM